MSSKKVVWHQKKWFGIKKSGLASKKVVWHQKKWFGIKKSGLLISKFVLLFLSKADIKKAIFVFSFPFGGPILRKKQVSMGKEGIEPSTLYFGNIYSVPLSYKPKVKNFLYL